ncbi:MAG: hypothetical protein II337_05410, partial [Clostridia bacterium]|nr:hypothetical protein [Clostridia bacterium]
GDSNDFKNHVATLDEKCNIQEAIAFADRYCDIKARENQESSYTTYDEYPLYMRGNKFQYLGAPM